jgi:hypothetical protein
MIQVTRKDRQDGSIVLKVGRKNTVLSTHGEADAFMAGVRIAHARLVVEINEILTVKDS